MFETFDLRGRVRGHAERNRQLRFGIMHKQMRVGESEARLGDPFLGQQQLRFGGETQVNALFDRVEVGLGKLQILLGRAHGSLRGVVCRISATKA